MRPLAILPVLLLTGAPPAVLDAREGPRLESWWRATSGLSAKLTEDDRVLELRADHIGLFTWFWGVPSGTLLLRGHRSGDDFSGTAFVFAFSPDCTFSYPVQGRFADGGTKLEWWGAEPKDHAPNSCRVVRSQFTTTTLRLKWAAPPPPPPPAPPPAPVVKYQPPARPGASDNGPWFDFTLTVPTMIGLAVGGIGLAAVAGFVLRLLYLKGMHVLAQARLALAEKRSQLAAMGPAAAGVAGLSPTEIENLLSAGFPEIEAELRASLARTLAAAIKDKTAP